MTADALRCEGDRNLAAQLVEDPHVKRVVRRLEAHEAESPTNVRRQLLATSLRLTRGMAPEVYAMVDHCIERLAVKDPLELFVYPSPVFNAAAVKPEAGRLFVMLSSSLLEAFRGGELQFVLGHELAHHVFGHHDIPIGVILKGKTRPSPELALKLFSWSRYAEISADRAGAACADDPDAAAGALFRLASGLRTDVVRVSIEEFAAQVDDMSNDEHDDPRARSTQTDWFTTHPFSPLRVKALKHFADSELNREGGDSLDMLEAYTETLMALMEPSYLDAKTDMAERMRRLLFAGAIAVADADEKITEEEVAVFEKFFGKRSLSDKLDFEQIKDDLDDRIADAVEHIPPPKRVQVLRDLCVVARAGDAPDPAANRVLTEIATKLQVNVAVVDQTLACALDPG